MEALEPRTAAVETKPRRVAQQQNRGQKKGPASWKTEQARPHGAVRDVCSGKGTDRGTDRTTQASFR